MLPGAGELTERFDAAVKAEMDSGENSSGVVGGSQGPQHRPAPSAKLEPEHIHKSEGVSPPAELTARFDHAADMTALDPDGMPGPNFKADISEPGLPFDAPDHDRELE